MMAGMIQLWRSFVAFDALEWRHPFFVLLD